MRFNGTPKQNALAEKIVKNAGLTGLAAEALLWYAGLTMRSRGVCDVRSVLDNQEQLAAYADSLIRDASNESGRAAHIGRGGVQRRHRRGT